MSKKIWIIRHGESTANAGGITSDHRTIPLSPLGEEQALRISQMFDEEPTLIITSPFNRAIKTAEPTIKRFPNVEHIIWPIEEFTYLAPHTCVNTTAVERKARVDEYWNRMDPDYIDGEDAESFNYMLGRAKVAIKCLSRHEDGFIVLFTHALFMQAMEALRTIDGKENVKSLMAKFRDLPRYGNCEVLKWE